VPRYQVVLQWQSEALGDDYSKLIEIEDLLCESLTGNTNVDGHDAGSAEFNIFILTDDPRACFQQVRAALEGRNSWAEACVAYRETTGDEYTVLWPEGLAEFRVT
jgi:hypothetical protein